MKAIYKSLQSSPMYETYFVAPAPSRTRSPKAFVPFLCERDGLNRLITDKKREPVRRATTNCFFSPPRPKNPKIDGLLPQLYKESLALEEYAPNLYTRHQSIPTLSDVPPSLTFDEKAWKSKSIIEKNVMSNMQSPKRSSTMKISQKQLKKMASSPKEGPYGLTPKAKERLRTMTSFTNISLKTLNEIDFCAARKSSINSIGEEQESEELVKEMMESKTQPKIERKKTLVIKKKTEVESWSPCVVPQQRRASAFKIVTRNSHFKTIKTEYDQDTILKEQKEFRKSMLMMKQRINSLRSSIGENFVNEKMKRDPQFF